MKYCTKCKTDKLETEFTKCSATRDGLQAHCKACCHAYDNAWKLANPDKVKGYRKGKARRDTLAKYGLTETDSERLLVRQGGGCAICGSTNPGGVGRFHVDHDHVTGKVRGLLCHNHNTGLGLFGDNAELLTAALKYLSASETT